MIESMSIAHSMHTPEIDRVEAYLDTNASEIGRLAQDVQERYNDGKRNLVPSVVGLHETQRHHFEALARLLHSIQNIPTDARPDLRIKNNALVAELATDRNCKIIDGFRFDKFIFSPNDTIDALSALGINSEAALSRKERFLRDLSSIGNFLLRREPYLARDKYFRLNREELEKQVLNKATSIIKAASSELSNPHASRFNPPLYETSPDIFARLSTTDLKKFRLYGMPLYKADFRYGDFSGQNLSGSQLPYDLTGADLTNTDLLNVTFGPLAPSERQCLEWRDRPHYPDFSGVKMENVRLTMPSPFESQLRPAVRRDEVATLTSNCDHTTHPESGSLLSSIHSINNSSLKKTLMEEQATHLLRQQPYYRAIAKPLTDILFNLDYLDPESASDAPRVRELVNLLVNDRFFTSNPKALDLAIYPNINRNVFLEEHLSHANKLIDACIAENRPGLDSAPATFCQQLIQACANTEDGKVRDRALALQQRIFSLPANLDALPATPATVATPFIVDG